VKVLPNKQKKEASATVSSAASSSSVGWSVDTIPNPKRDPVACGLHPDTSKFRHPSDRSLSCHNTVVFVENSWVCNPDGILDGDTFIKINDEIEKVSLQQHHQTDWIA
jgi:hypothetical protein